MYDQTLLARLPEHARRGAVATLCRKPLDTYAATAAAVIEDWVARFKPPGKTISELTGADDTSFWAALWELTVATVMADLGFTVDMRAEIGGLTPDLLIERDGLVSMVEVFAMGDDQALREEKALLRRLSAELARRIELPPQTFVSLSALRPIMQYPDETVIAFLAATIDEWLAPAPEAMLDLSLHAFPVIGSAMPGGEVSDIVISTSARALNQSTRLGRRLVEKIARYAPLVTDERRLMIAIGAGSWTITENQVVTALYGNEVMQVGPDGNVVRLAFDGSGAAVTSGPNGADDAGKLTGTWVFSRQGWDEGNPAMFVETSFAYNPYCAAPLPPATFAPATFRLE